MSGASNGTFTLSGDAKVPPVYSEDVRLGYQRALLYPHTQKNHYVNGWYDEDATAQFSAPASVPMPGILGVLGGKLIFDGWYENGKHLSAQSTGEITMFDAYTLTAQWNADYTTPIITLGVIAIVIAASALFFVMRSRKKS